MAKSTKVQSTKVRNLVVSIPCIFCKFPHTLFAYIKYIFSKEKPPKCTAYRFFWSNLSACEVNVNTIIL